MSIIQGTSKAAGGAVYEIDQSIRFDKTTSSHLSKTYGSAGNRRTWTFSTWFKRGKIDSTRQSLFAATGQAYLQIGPDAASREMITILNEGSGTNLNWYTTFVYSDPSAWYHLVWQFDSTQSTADDRTKLYINGSQVTDFTKAVTPSLNLEGAINNSVEHKISEIHIANYYFDGYQAEINFIDGTALDASSFGETNDDGVWIPKAYDGSYGTNGFYITGATASDLGEDFSGNNNDFTSSGLATTDQMLDTPTKNWCTWNNIDTSFNNNVTSDGNLVITTASPGYTRFQLGTIGVSSGKWEWKWTPTASLSDGGIGVDDGTSQAATGASSGAFSSQSANGFIYRSGGTKLVGGTASSYGATFAAGDVIRCQIDLDAGTPTIEFFKNDVSQGSINMNAGVTYFPCQFSADASLVTVADFGQSGFTAAAGFNTLNTANLPTPTVADGSKYFQPTLYAGTGSTRSVDQSGNSTFEPGFVWIKARDAAYDHALYDQVRGVTKELKSNATDAEATIATGLTAFESDGFQVGSRLGVNDGTKNFVAWQWLANGAGSSNTDGTVASTVSANPTAGFSIAKWTHTTASNYTVGHGLGAVPKMILVKTTDQGTNWGVYHSDITVGKRLILNTTSAQVTGYWGANSWTSSTFSIGSVRDTNGSTAVAYCFAEIPGYSSIGSYTGNGLTDGPFVYTDFKPAFVIFKNISASGQSWEMFDNKRDGFNDANRRLYPNASDTEPAASDRVRLTSNGFKIVTSGGTHVNGSGNTIIYMAFAENPFGGDGVAPATAR